jgi:hypothetical protein
MKSNYPKAFVALFIIVMLLPLRTFTADQEQFAESFWGRPRFIAGLSDFRLLIGDRVFTNLIVSRDYWLVYTGELSTDDYQRVIPFREDQLSEFQHNLDAFNDKLRAEGVALLVVIVPNKNTIYPEYMPDEIPVMGDVSRFDQIVQYMAAHGATRILDLRSALLAARQTRQVYYAMDSHWNEYGAFIGYQEIITALKKDFPALQARPLSDYASASLGKVRFDLAGMSGGMILTKEKFHLVPLFESQTTARSIDIGESRKLTFSANPDGGLPRAVVYHDSFFFDVIPLISENFSHAIFIPIAGGREVVTRAWLAEIQPDVVIIEITERYISELVNFINH